MVRVELVELIAELVLAIKVDKNVITEMGLSIFVSIHRAVRFVGRFQVSPLQPTLTSSESLVDSNDGYAHPSSRGYQLLP